jgi:hypothetical protein
METAAPLIFWVVLFNVSVNLFWVGFFFCLKVTVLVRITFFIVAVLNRHDVTILLLVAGSWLLQPGSLATFVVCLRGVVVVANRLVLICIILALIFAVIVRWPPSANLIFRCFVAASFVFLVVVRFPSTRLLVLTFTFTRSGALRKETPVPLSHGGARTPTPRRWWHHQALPGPQTYATAACAAAWLGLL